VNDEPNNDTENETQVQLHRGLGTFEVTVLGYGAMVGASIFILAGVVTGIAGPAILIAIVLNYLVSLLTGYNYAEASSRSPEVGGGYLWVKEAMGPLPAYLAGWISWLGHSIACSFYILVIGKGLAWLFGFKNLGQTRFFGLPLSLSAVVRFLAILIAVIFLYINYRGITTTRRSEFIIITIQIIILSILVIAAVLRIISHPENITPNVVPFLPHGQDSIIIAMGVMFIAYEGYEICAQTGEEAKNPHETIPRAIFLSMTALVLTYLLVIGTVILAVGAGDNSVLVKGGEHGLLDAAGILIPVVGFPLLTIAMLFGAAATLNATIYSSSRVSLALARDRSLPRKLLKIHSQHRTPHYAIWMTGALIIFFAVFLPFQDIIASADILFLLLFTVVNYSVYKLRREHGDQAFPFRTPFFPLLPILGLVTKAFLAIFLFIYSPTAWLVALIWITLGLVIYYSKNNTLYR